jgi:type I restriction enzyme S subunit
MWRDEVMDCCFQNTLVRFRCDLSKIVPDFALAAFLRMYHDGHLSKIASKTSNVAHLGAGRFLKLPIVLPPLQLQNAFAEQSQRLESLARHLDAAAAKAEAMAAGLSAEVFGSTKNRAENHGLCHST